MTKQRAITYLTYQRERGKPIRDHQRRAFISMMYLNKFEK